MERWIWYAVFGVNALTFVVYGADKLCAIRRWRRVPEAHLLFLAFLTGWIGAWVGMALFRHKTAKKSFRWALIAVTVLNPFWAVIWFGLG